MALATVIVVCTASMAAVSVVLAAAATARSH